MVKNCGQTPAHNLVYTTRLFLAPVESENTLPPFAPLNATNNSISLPPGGETYINDNASLFIDGGDYNKFISGAYRLFFYGEMSYVDSFGKRRKTRFKLTSAFPLTNSAFICCKNGNEAD
jgi:hypothetical protein